MFGWIWAKLPCRRPDLEVARRFEVRGADHDVAAAPGCAAAAERGLEVAQDREADVDRRVLAGDAARRFRADLAAGDAGPDDRHLAADERRLAGPHCSSPRAQPDAVRRRP